MKPFLKIGTALVYTPAHFTLYGWHVRQVLVFPTTMPNLHAFDRPRSHSFRVAGPEPQLKTTSEYPGLGTSQLAPIVPNSFNSTLF